MEEELKTLYPQTGIIERTKVALPKMEFTISFSSPPQEPYLFQKGEGKLFTKSSYAQLTVSMLHRTRRGGEDVRHYTIGKAIIVSNCTYKMANI